MKIHHYYHVFADGDWEPIWLEHWAAVQDSGLDLASCTVGIVGSLENRMVVEDLMHPWFARVAEDTGYEQVTLDKLYDDLAGMADDDVVLYAHTKGAAFPVEVSRPWRNCMTSHLITHADLEVLPALRDGADTVGCHWLTPEEFPNHNVNIPYYGGNFWWSTVRHLKRLPPPSHRDRFQAEAWLGTVRPENPVNLVQGWPGYGCAHHG